MFYLRQREKCHEDVGSFIMGWEWWETQRKDLEERKGMGSEMRGNDKISVNNGACTLVGDQEEPDCLFCVLSRLRNTKKELQEVSLLVVGGGEWVRRRKRGEEGTKWWEWFSGQITYLAVLPNKSLFWKMKRLQPLAEVTMIRSTCESSWGSLVERVLIGMCVCVHLLRKFFLSGVFGIKRGKSWTFFFFFDGCLEQAGCIACQVWTGFQPPGHLTPEGYSWPYHSTVFQNICIYQARGNCLIILREILQTNKRKDKKIPEREMGKRFEWEIHKERNTSDQ